MKTYFIEPGDWEAATGECLPSGSAGISVVSVEEAQKELLRLQKALLDIVRHQEIMGGSLSVMSSTRMIAAKALKEQ